MVVLRARRTRALMRRQADCADFTMPRWPGRSTAAESAYYFSRLSQGVNAPVGDNLQEARMRYVNPVQHGRRNPLRGAHRPRGRHRGASGRAAGAGNGAAGSIGGVVQGAKGPEAGVWVIAETRDLPTNFIKIVVTDDQGRFMLPELPPAGYDVWVRGYGLVDSKPVQMKPGTAQVTLRRRRPTPRRKPPRSIRATTGCRCSSPPHGRCFRGREKGNGIARGC